ncbi:Cys-tRNA(Pro) deacylase [Clostridiaceae bacterium 35-E11]
MAQPKTNAMRILDKNKINYNVITYNSEDGKIDGISVAEKIQKDVDVVYKTLVLQGNSKSIFVCVIPVKEELDLKKAAKVANEKKVEMIHIKDIKKHTGYIRGGCSPIGMKKEYKTFIDESALNLDEMIVSGGKTGIQIELSVKDLLDITRAEMQNIIK